MFSVLQLSLVVAAVGLVSGATFHTSSASAGSGLGGGGTAFTTSTRFNNRPATTTSFTSGTGQTFSSSGSTGFSSLGNRGAFRPVSVPRVPTFSFRPITFPRIRVPQYQYRPQTQFVSSGIGTRFGGSGYSGASAFSTSGGSGFNSIDTSSYFNRLSNQINRSFAANLRG